MFDTHHAFVYYDRNVTDLEPELQTVSTDVLHVCVERFGIDDSRTVSASAVTAPVVRPYKEIVIQFSTITTEAQNALLKILEEPPPQARFHVLAPGPESLLKTVRSRLAVVEHMPTSADTSVWQTFQAEPIAVQLDMITQRAKAQDTAWQQTILASAVADVAVPAATRLLLDSAMRSPGASRKMLLEELVLIVAKQRSTRYNDET